MPEGRLPNRHFLHKAYNRLIAFRNLRQHSLGDGFKQEKKKSCRKEHKNAKTWYFRPWKWHYLQQENLSKIEKNHVDLIWEWVTHIFCCSVHAHVHQLLENIVLILELQITLLASRWIHKYKIFKQWGAIAHVKHHSYRSRQNVK